MMRKTTWLSNHPVAFARRWRLGRLGRLSLRGSPVNRQTYACLNWRRHVRCRRRHAWWGFHQDKPGIQQVPDEPIGRDPAHCMVCVMDPPPTVVAERKGKRFGNLVSRCSTKRGYSCHGAS